MKRICSDLGHSAGAEGSASGRGGGNYKREKKSRPLDRSTSDDRDLREQNKCDKDEKIGRSGRSPSEAAGGGAVEGEGKANKENGLHLE